MDLSKLSSDLPSTTNIETVSLSKLNSELTDQFKNAAKSVTSLYNVTSKNSKEEVAVNKAAFSDSARAVASLYRTGTECNTLLMHKGYLDSLDDVLQVITQGDDIENWVLTKRAEIVNYYNHKEDKDLTSKAKSPIVPSSASGSNSAPALPKTADSGLTSNAGSKQITAASSSPTLSVTEFDLEQLIASEVGFNMSLSFATDLRFRPSFPPLSMTYKRRKGRLDNSRRKLSSLNLESAASSEDSDGDHFDPVEQKRRTRSTNTESSKRRKRDSLGSS